MRDSIILHSDLNHFYAAVEILYNPSLRNLPVAVCGDPEARHGIVLTKNPIAKRFGVTTGQPIWQAKQLCPKLVVIPPHYDLYLKFSKMARDIYYDYTDLIEPFGIDEAWLDVTGSTILFGDGEAIAQKIRRRIFKELGITVSIGVSFNKIYAKLGSDYKKPDAVTVFTRENYKEKVWSLPVADLLYVGKATENKLKKFRIYTIGDLAKCDTKLLYSQLGKVGIMLQRFANGYDHTPVNTNDSSPIIKSIGNSLTTPRDLTTDDDVWVTLSMLSESVATRLRENGFRCNTVQISLRDKNLFSCERQTKTKVSTCLSTEIATTAMEIFQAKYHMNNPLRSVGVRACDLIPMNSNTQLSLLYDYKKQKRLENLETTIDDLRKRYGYMTIQKGNLLIDKELSGHDAKEHIIHPYALFNDKIPI